MELLRVNITNDGRLVGNKQERLSLVEEDGNTLDSAKLAESTKFTPIAKEQEPKKNESLNNSTQSYSPPSVYLSAYLDTRSPISISFHKAPARALLSSRRRTRTKPPLLSGRAAGAKTQRRSARPKTSSILISKESSSSSTDRLREAFTSLSIS